ncbi:MAG: ParB/RepB/Spo0J family partition protein [bacterium]|nr:ParB/RepB/Spo0J family partition protein [bacterium]
MVENISIEKLREHPDNPRRNVGDVTELAESIKANGILQNLTVVPCTGYYYGNYTVIIGHRRLAAAKLAGLTELPCAVVQMDDKQQIATMLLENMQRSDLTIYEQAQGFQMMLDLGETQSSIAKQTGFSKTTVSRRLKLLNLDKDKFMEADNRGGTLEDYIKVAEIKDEKIRNAVTDAIGTQNFEWELRKAHEKQQLNEAMPSIKAEMKKIGAKRDDKIYNYDGKHEVVCEIMVKDFKEGCLANKCKNNIKYWWNILGNAVKVYRLKPVEKKKAVKKSDKEIKAISRRKELESITERAYECRKSFVMDFYIIQKDNEIINDWLWEVQYRRLSGQYSNTSWDILCDRIGEEYEKYKYSCKRENLDRFVKEHPKNANIIILYAVCGDSGKMGYYEANNGEEMPSYKKNNRLDLIYKYLCKLGYKMSDEEKALKDGTHEFYMNGGDEDE